MKSTILIQLDTDPQPSTFDAVVAIDAGAEHLLRHGGVAADAVRDLVHGALFTRGGDDLKRSALFIGGSNVHAAEELFEAAREAFFGPFRVSVLFDPNGANTTAAAAVLAAEKGCDGKLAGTSAAVLGATGPVGQRVARLLAREGVSVSVGSRSLDRASGVAEEIGKQTGTTLRPFATANEQSVAEALDGIRVVIAAGAAGVQLLSKSVREGLRDLKVAIDLNAVPPVGIEGLKPTDVDVDHGGVRCWGALGVGGTKMKIHKAAVRALFESNDRLLDAEEILALGRSL